VKFTDFFKKQKKIRGNFQIHAANPVLRNPTRGRKLRYTRPSLANQRVALLGRRPGTKDVMAGMLLYSCCYFKVERGMDFSAEFCSRN